MKRKLILKGQFLFRYKVDKNGEAKGGPTGIPVSIENGSFEADIDNPRTFEINSLFQKYRYTCDTVEECQAWLKALNEVNEKNEKAKFGVLETINESDEVNFIFIINITVNVLIYII